MFFEKGGNLFLNLLRDFEMPSFFKNLKMGMNLIYPTIFHPAPGSPTEKLSFTVTCLF